MIKKGYSSILARMKEGGREGERERERARERERERESARERQTDRERERKRGRERKRQTDREEGGRDGQTERERERKRERDKFAAPNQVTINGYRESTHPSLWREVVVFTIDWWQGPIVSTTAHDKHRRNDCALENTQTVILH